MAIPLNDPSKLTNAELLRARARQGTRDGRGAYRVPKQPGANVEVGILCEDGRKATGECVDVSIGGAGVSLPRTKDLELIEGTKVRVRVQHMSRARGIEANAEVVTVAQTGASVRYGLRFVDVNEVIQQVDSFYARWFNRRRNVRVMPDFTTKVSGTVKWSDGELSARVHDISMGGVGVLATLDQVKPLKIKSRVEIALTLPNSPLPIVCRARIVGMKAFTKNVLVGLEFEPNGGIERYAVGLQRYVDERQAQITQFNHASSQTPKRAG